MPTDHESLMPWTCPVCCLRRLPLTLPAQSSVSIFCFMNSEMPTERSPVSLHYGLNAMNIWVKDHNPAKPCPREKQSMIREMIEACWAFSWEEESRHRLVTQRLATQRLATQRHATQRLATQWLVTHRDLSLKEPCHSQRLVIQTCHSEAWHSEACHSQKTCHSQKLVTHRGLSLREFWHS